MNQKKESQSWIASSVEAFRHMVEKEVANDNPYEDCGLSIGIVVFGVLTGLYFAAHQARETGFFTEAFGTWEMLMLYGIPVFWIATSTLIIFGRKERSRDLDSFGGLIFATIAHAWLLVTFPFEFAHFADMLPEFLRFLAEWVSADIARVLIVLAFGVHLGFAVFSAILRVCVYKARTKRRLHGLYRVEGELS